QRDEYPGKIGRDTSAASTDRRHGPGDGLAENVLALELRGDARWKIVRQFRGHIDIGASVQFLPGQPNFHFRCAQNFRRKIKEAEYPKGEDRQREDRVVVNEGKTAEDDGVFGEAESDVREGLGRSVTGQARGGF